MARTTLTSSAYRAKESFAIPDGHGGTRVIQKGSLLPPSDAVVASHRALFQPVDEFVEQTTAGPGEIRSVHIPSKESDDAASTSA